MGRIIGLTGGKGKGKTTACLNLAGQLSDQGVIVKGFCSPPVFTDGIKTGIDVVSLPSFERRRLGLIGELEGFIQIRVWSMDPKTFDWINHMMKRFTSSDLLMFDEFGPLEVEQQKGWHKALDVLKTANYHVAVITFRPDYSEFFIGEFPEIEMINLDDENSADILAKKVKAYLDQAKVMKVKAYD